MDRSLFTVIVIALASGVNAQTLEDRVCDLEVAVGIGPCSEPPPPPPPPPPSAPIFFVTPWDSIPNPAASPTVTSVQSGDWSASSTWSTGLVPSQGDVVWIPSGHSVVYDLDSSVELAAVGVAGDLAWRTDIPTRMIVGTLIVPEGGVLEVGTVAQPVTATAEIVIADRPLATTAHDPDTGVLDPSQYLTGLLVLGRVSMAGSHRNPTFVRSDVPLTAGVGMVVLEVPPAGWRVGDRLGFTDSRHLDRFTSEWDDYVPAWEVRTVAAINGAEIALDAPLAFDHPGAYDPDGTVWRLPHVANLGRSVTIVSENPGGTRGHVFFTHRAEVDLSHVAFRDLGRTLEAPIDDTTYDGEGNVVSIGTNQRGRYALHLHHVWGDEGGVAPVYRVDGVSVEETLSTNMKWGATIHDAHFGSFTNSVLFNAASGASLALEDGSESANVIEGNFIGVTRSIIERSQPFDSQIEDGLGGWSIWSEGPLNTYRDNVVSAASFGGAYINGRITVLVPSVPGGVPDVPIDLTTSTWTELSGTECYGAMRRCLDPWTIDPPSPPVIQDTTAWHLHGAALAFYLLPSLTIDGWQQRGDMAMINVATSNFAIQTAFQMSGSQNERVTARNVDIRGVQQCVRQRSRAAFDAMLLEDATLQCLGNIEIRALATEVAAADGRITNTIRRVSTLPVPGYSSTDLEMTWAPSDNDEVLINHETLVEDWQGVVGNTFEVFWTEQDGAQPIAWQNPSNVDQAIHPDPGQTNQESWSAGNGATAGRVATCTETRPGITGYAC